MTRNGSLHEIFTTMSETLVNFIKFSRRQIEVDSQYQVQHWPYTNYTYCSYTLTILIVASYTLTILIVAIHLLHLL